MLYALAEHLPIQRSSDGGRTWSPIGERSCGRTLNQLTASPHTPRVLYAATADRGSLVTRDGGDTWMKSKGLPKAPLTAITESMNTSGFLLAAILSGDLYQSVDGSE